MTEYRIIETRVYDGRSLDIFPEQVIHSCFKNLGTQGDLFNEPKTSWKKIFELYNCESIEYELTKVSEFLAKEGFSKNDIITTEGRKRNIYDDYGNIEPSSKGNFYNDYSKNYENEIRKRLK